MAWAGDVSVRKAGGAIVALLVLGLLVLAPGAQAAKGVYDVLPGSGSKGGEFWPTSDGGLNGVAVNTNGAGGANPGDVYIVEAGNHRVQRLTADGAFISAWGLDVDSGGGTGYEICTVAANCQKASTAGAVGGALNDPRGIAIDQVTGSVYVSNRLNRRIEMFTATGDFVRAFGQDVVGAAGAEQADEQQRLTVDAAAGQYKLTFGGKTTGDIEWNETAAGLETKLNALESIGGTGGSVVVTGGLGGAGGMTPYLITFGGSLANTNQAAITVSAGTTPLSGGTAAATIANFNEGAIGFEICESAANCKAGAAVTTGGGFRNVEAGIGGLAVAPPGAPNGGRILVADATNNRVQEFTSAGSFVRTFGFDVVASGPSNTGIAFEVCSVAALDICKTGSSGGGDGQFEGLIGIAEDASGNVYTVEPRAGFRVQRFKLLPIGVTPLSTFLGSLLSGSGGLSTAGDLPVAVAVDTSTAPGTPGTVYVPKYFPQGFGSPPLEKKELRILEVDPAAAGGEGEVTGTLLAKAGAGTDSNSFASLALNTTSGRLFITTPPDRVFIVDEVPALTVSLDPTEVAGSAAVLHGTITPSQIPLDTLYHFEYAKAGSGEWKRAPALPAPDVNIGNGASPVPVSQEVQGLEINTCYELRAVAHTDYFGAEGLDEGQFCTEPVPPQVSTGGARWSSPPASGPSLTLFGQINPNNDQTEYYFEYASKEAFDAGGFDASARIPLLPAAAGHGSSNTAILQSIKGLDPTKTYVYRLVASNSAGVDAGDPRTIAPPDPNARFYELVSDADSAGLGLIGIGGVKAVSDDGQRVALVAQAIGDPSSLPAQRSPFLAQRGAGGWGVEQVTPNPEEGRGGNALEPSAWYPADLSTALWLHYSPAGQIRGEVSWTFTDPGKVFREALPTLVPVMGHGTVETTFGLTGGAADLSSFVFQRMEANSPAKKVQALYVPGQPLTTGEPGDIYRVAGAGGPSPSLTLLNRDPAGDLISNACGAWLGGNKAGPLGSTPAPSGMSLRPVSSDGSITYFSAAPSGSASCDPLVNRVRIFKRIGDSSTVEISKSQCVRTVPTSCSVVNGDDVFQGASENGNRAFFTTTRQLADSDEDSTADLYLYDSSPPVGQPTLVQASAGEIATTHPKAGSGAEVQGVVDISVDGSRAYFVAKGRLTDTANAQGQTAAASASNLYLYQRDGAHPTGQVAFVAKLDGADGSLWGAGQKPAFALPFRGPAGQGAGDGRFLLFSSAAKLLGADTDSKADLYRYENATTAQLICLTCAGNGDFGISVSPHTAFEDPAGIQRSRIASEDLSTVVFATAEQLDPADENSVPDAYEWHEGTLALVSSGESGSAGLSNVPGAASTPMISADGASVLFTTEDRLLASDPNVAVDAYSARLGGGFPEKAEVQGCVSADECRTAPVAPPNAPSAPSSSFSGPGNVKSAPRCAKGKVKKKGRCVKKKAKKKQKKHQRNGGKRKAGNDRGGKR